MSDADSDGLAPSSSKSERKSGSMGSTIPSKAKRTKHGRFVSDITLSEIESMFCYPAEEAAAKLGVCLTILKRLCRKFGISRWPYRRLKCAMKLKEHGMNPELVLNLNNPFQPATAAAVAAHIADPPKVEPAPRASDRPRRQAALGVAAVVDRAKEDIKDAEVATVPVSRRPTKPRMTGIMPPLQPAVPEVGPDELAHRSVSGSGDSVSLSALMEAVKYGSVPRQLEQDAGGLLAAMAPKELPTSVPQPTQPLAQPMAALETMLAMHQAQQAQAAMAAMAAAAGPGSSQSSLFAALSSAFAGMAPPPLAGFPPTQQDLLAQAAALPLWNQGSHQAAAMEAMAPLPLPPPPRPPAPAASPLDTASTERLNGAIMGLASLLKQANMPSAGWGSGPDYSK